MQRFLCLYKQFKGCNEDGTRRPHELRMAGGATRLHRAALGCQGTGPPWGQPWAGAPAHRTHWDRSAFTSPLGAGTTAAIVGSSAFSRRKDKTAFPALTVKFHPYRASLLIHSIGEREGMHREQRDITYFKTGILLCHYFMLYFMTNPSERTKTSLISSPSPVLSAPSPLCSIPLDWGCDSAPLKFQDNNLKFKKRPEGVLWPKAHFPWPEHI